ncbi:MAG: uracil phosphoribosyltransferase [Alphaproteobacteria bacterium]|nr:uracil phosphoribosyltransferase [Alphaproteobacteria bacterium]
MSTETPTDTSSGPASGPSRNFPDSLHIVDHPLILHKLTLMRDKNNSSASFRTLLREISLLLAYEVLRDLPMTTMRIETPITEMEAPILAGKKLVLIPILRAGSGFLDGMLELVPSARVGHIGLFRDPKTLQPVEYFLKLPDNMETRTTVIVDPMLATANSAIAAIQRLKEEGAKDIRFLCLLAAPEGVHAFAQAHPDVPVYTAAVDSHLNEKGYIVPGLGDAGDRIFGTK